MESIITWPGQEKNEKLQTNITHEQNVSNKILDLGKGIEYSILTTLGLF